MSEDETPTGETLDRGQLQDKAIRGAAWTVIHTAVSVPIAFVVNLLVARILGVVDYGRLAFLTTVMEIATGVVALGLSSAIIQYASKAHASGRQDEVRRLLSAAQGFRLLVAAPVLTLVVIASARVDLPLLVLAILFGIWAPAALEGALDCLAVENKTGAGAKIAMVTNVLVQTAVLVALFAITTPDAVWASRLMVTGALFSLALIPISPAYRRAVLRPTLPNRFPAGFWRFAVPTGVSALVAWLVLSRTEVFFLTWLSTAGAVGLFAFAYGVANHVFAPAQALMGPLIPAVSGLREVDSDAVGRAFERTLRAGSTVVGALMAMVLPPLAVLVPVLYSDQYAAASPLVVVLGISGGILIAAGPVTAFVLARLSASRLLWGNLVALVVDVVLAILLIPPLAAWGAVIANVAGAGTRLAILLWGEVRALDLSWRRTAAQVRPAVLGALACAGAWLLTEALPWPPLVEAALGGTSAAAVFFGGLAATRSGLTAGDAEAIARNIPGRAASPGRALLRLLTRNPS